jgi:hypothetical protein
MAQPYPLITLSRLERMTKQYGEAVTKVDAARMLNVSRQTILAMTNDGRLETVCEGRKISVQSIAEYMDRPAQFNYTARYRKRNGGSIPSSMLIYPTRAANNR